MEDSKFREIATRRLRKCENVLQMKSVEYARDGDRLSNFKHQADMLGVESETALLGNWSKHLSSIIDLVDDLEQGETVSLSQLQEKLTDSINYHLLLEALVIERMNEQW